jgi:hypothetical protein
VKKFDTHVLCESRSTYSPEPPKGRIGKNNQTLVHKTGETKMSVKLHYLGQNDSVNCTPAVFLTGDPGTDQQTLKAGGYVGGVIVAILGASTNAAYPIQPPNQPAFGQIGNIAPCDTDATYYGSGNAGTPFATLLNNGGEFAGAIGPSGSKKAPVVRAMWQGMVGNSDGNCYDTSAAFTLGAYLYCGCATSANIGQYTSAARSHAASPAVGICTHVPTTTEAWLGVASLL